MSIKSQLSQLKIISCCSNAHCVLADIVIEGTELTVTPQAARLLLKEYPSLAQHACKSHSSANGMQVDSGEISSGSQALLARPSRFASQTFGDRLVGALLPHAVEHLAIELMVRAYPGEVFAGNTCWISREEQCMRVRVSLPKAGTSAEAQSILSEAVMLFNGLLASCQRQIGKETLS